MSEALAESPEPIEIDPQALAELVRTRSPLAIVDCRTQEERRFVHLAGSVHIPLDELASRQGELDPETPVVVLCHHGVRSLRAAAFLREEGFAARSLAGGLERWSAQIDPTLPRYTRLTSGQCVPAT